MTTEFHHERLSAILRELWAANNIDLHMCDGQVKNGQSGLLQNLREDIGMVLADYYARIMSAIEPAGVGVETLTSIIEEYANEHGQQTEHDSRGQTVDVVCADLLQAIAALTGDEQ